MKDFEVALAKEICPACGETHDGPILMNTLLTPNNAAKVRELHGKPIGFHMCNRCQEIIDNGGIFLVEIDPEKSSGKPGDTLKQEDAYRTGRMWGIKSEALAKVFNIPLQPIMFIGPDVAEQLGLP